LAVFYTLKKKIVTENLFATSMLLLLLLLFDDRKVRMGRKPGKKRKENPAGEGKGKVKDEKEV